MTKFSHKTLDYIRAIAGTYTQRPLGGLLLTNQQYPDTTVTYTVATSSTTITLSNGSTNFTVTYFNKSIKQVAQELSNSPYPISVLALADIQQLGASELRVSGTSIPTSFDIEDISSDGKSVIVRCLRYSSSYNKLSALGINAPYSQGPSLPWWARITNGSFTQAYKGIRYHFGIPEYKNQTWSTNWGRPFMDVEGEPASFIGKNAIQLSRFPVLYKNNNIALISANGDKAYPASVIKDVNTINGIIYLNENVGLSKNLYVYYTYLENSLLYMDLNLNGHFSQNPYVLDKYVVYYAVPIKSSSGIERTRGIYHSIGTSLDDAIFSIKVDNINEPITLIGAINVKINNSPQFNVIDTRSFGGGLLDNELGIATQKKFKESEYFFDIGHKEGIPYPGSASIVVELPSELKETMSLADIRALANKNVAAGVYPIYKFPEEDFYDKFQEVDINSDISLLNYSLSYSNSNLNELVFGLTGKAANFVDVTMELPKSGIYYSGYDTTGWSGPTLQNDILVLQPGQQFKATYIKGSADAVMSYESRTYNTQWKRHTVYNTTPVKSGQISAQGLLIDAKYSYREIRNVTGLAPYIPTTGFWNNVAYSAAKTIDTLRQISSTTVIAQPTGYFTDIINVSLAPESTGMIGVKPLVEPLLVNYDIMVNNNFYKDFNLLNTASRIVYFGTTGATFPLPLDYINNRFGTDPYSGQYNALYDIHAYARYAHHKIDQHYLEFTENQQAINLTGSSSWLTSNSSLFTAWAYSGALNIANKLLSINTFTGGGLALTYAVTPYYNPATNAAIPLTGPYGPSEVNPTYNNLHLGSNVVKAFAAVYSSQVAPWSGDISSIVRTNVLQSPRNIALSGLAAWTTYFPNYFNTPTYFGTGVQNSWVTTYNRISELGSVYLDNVCNAVDYLLYGNKVWAGWTGYELKKGTYYNSTGSPNLAFSGDTTWNQTIEWPDFSSRTAIESLQLAVTGIYDSLVLMEPYIKASAYNGGIIQPGQFKALKYFLWHPIHSGLAEPFFTGITGQRLVDTFEIGMAAALKGSLNEDGILLEGGSFKHQHAPFSGQVPADMLDACASAIKYYNIVGNTKQVKKWTAIAEGIYNTTQNLYSFSGGYPYGVIFGGTASGDPGSRQLPGFLHIIDNRPQGPFSTGEFVSITGQVPRIV